MPLSLHSLRRVRVCLSVLTAGLCLPCPWIAASDAAVRVAEVSASEAVGGEDAHADVEILHRFNEPEGHQPFTSPLHHRGWIYGATHRGGEHGGGTVYRIGWDGTGWEVVHHFEPPRGQEPFGDMVVAGERLYGTTKFGGRHRNGTLYSLGLASEDGFAFAIHHEFGDVSGNLWGPNGPVTVDDRRLYGTAFHGGKARWSGGAWSYDLETEMFAILASLDPATGQHPTGRLLWFDGWLWGTMSGYGRTEQGDYGGVFRVRRDGSDFEVVHRFGNGGPGAHPYDSLSLGPDGRLWGTTFGDFKSADDPGTVFRLDPATLEVETIVDFAKLPHAGAKPNGGILFIGDGRGFFVTHGSDTRGGETPGTLLELVPPGDGEGGAVARLRVLWTFDGLETGITPMRSLTTDGSFLYGVAAFGGIDYGDDGPPDRSGLPRSGGLLYRLKVAPRANAGSGFDGSNHCSHVGERNGGTPSSSSDKLIER